jgi:Leucine-rich repeat (LRR) protein
MKKLLLILLCLPIIGFSQSYCSLLNVTYIDIDSLNMTIDIAVYDGNGGSPYPHAAYSIDAIGDTIHHGYLWLFANNGFDTTWYLYPINSFPIYPLSIYYVYGMNADTCILSFNNNSPQTYVPDDNFEQALINLGCDNVLDDYVLTAAIDTLTYLYVGGQNIANLTGIEDFTALTQLGCSGNQLTSLDVSQNAALTSLHCTYNQLTSLDVSGATALTYLICEDNQLTSLDVSNNTALTNLDCHENQLTSLDVSNNTALTNLDCHENQLTSLDVSANTALTYLYFSYNQLTSIDLSQNTVWRLSCANNQLTSLDVSNNTYLTHLWCSGNQLTSLDVRNGNNNLLDTNFYCTNNPNLSCINVDNFTWSSANWTNIDPQHYFSNNCNPSAIKEYTTNKELLKVTDLLGRETKQTNQPLFYIYDDGTVEKRIVIE